MRDSLKQAKDAAVETDKGVTRGAGADITRALKSEAKEGHLLTSMKAAAVGVARKAAADAATAVIGPMTQQYSGTLHARQAAERKEAAAKYNLGAAQSERLKQDQAAVAALTAEQVAAVAATEQSEYEAHLLEVRLAALRSNEDAVHATANQKARVASEARIHLATASKVSQYTVKADAAEKEAAAAKAAMDEALRVQVKAAAFKATALSMKQERDRLVQEAKPSPSSTASDTQLVEDERAVVPEHRRAGITPAEVKSSPVWSSKNMARGSVLLLCIGVAALALALGTQRAKA